MAELDLVVARHNEVGQERGFEFICAILCQKVDHLADKTGVEVTVEQFDTDGAEFAAVRFERDQSTVSILGDSTDVDHEVVNEALDGKTTIASAEQYAGALTETDGGETA